MAITLRDYRTLGKSGLRVSPMCLGAMTFGAPGWGTDLPDAQKMFDHFFDQGGNFIDTANFYSTGVSEEMVGKIVGAKRESTVISTKYSLVMRQGDPNGSGNHRRNMVRSVEESLKRLGTDYIDLLYLHMWDYLTPVEEILRAYDDLIAAGKVVYAGMSDVPAWQISRMQAISELRGYNPLIALQIQYSMIERTVEHELMPMALEMGLGVCPWSPLGGGVLTGKYSRDDLKPQEGDLSSRKKINLATGRLTEKALDMADVVKEVAGELGKTPAQVALAWTMQHPSVQSPVLGVRTFSQLEDNLGALSVDFSEDQIERLNAVSAIPDIFPHGMLNSDITKGIVGAAGVRKMW